MRDSICKRRANGMTSLPLSPPNDGDRYFFGVGDGEVAPAGASLASTAPSFRVKAQCASAFFPPIFASTMTEQESPCSGCVTW